LPYAIKKLQAAGYQLVTLAECTGLPAYQSQVAPGTRDVSYSRQFYLFLPQVNVSFNSLPGIAECRISNVIIPSFSKGYLTLQMDIPNQLPTELFFSLRFHIHEKM